METIIKTAWAAIAVVHIAPVMALFSPKALERLYGIAMDGDLRVLLTHRAALFLAIVVLSLFALVDPVSRRAASIVVATSVLGFLALYARAGLPRGPLRSIAAVDTFALVPLAIVLVAAWRVPR
jgi:hypothetical protein